MRKGRATAWARARRTDEIVDEWEEDRGYAR